MEKTTNYLQVLSESLDKKLTILSELCDLTEEQKAIAEAEDFDEEAFNRNVNQKAALIEELEKMDRGFQSLYNRIKAQITDRREQFRDEIALLQEKIRRILDQSSALQVAEQRNKKLIEQRFAALHKEARQVKKTREMAANYYKNMNNISSEPYFMDQKK